MYNSTLCYLENPRGEYLMLHRVKKKADINKGKWIGVGGKFEEGESPDECLRREVREETGLTLTHWRFRGVVTFLCNDSGSDQFMYLFTAGGWTGELRMDCDEGELDSCPSGRGTRSSSSCWRRTARPSCSPWTTGAGTSGWSGQCWMESASFKPFHVKRSF